MWRQPMGCLPLFPAEIFLCDEKDKKNKAFTKELKGRCFVTKKLVYTELFFSHHVH